MLYTKQFHYYDMIFHFDIIKFDNDYVDFYKKVGKDLVYIGGIKTDNKIKLHRVSEGCVNNKILVFKLDM